MDPSGAPWSSAHPQAGFQLPTASTASPPESSRTLPTAAHVTPPSVYGTPRDPANDSNRSVPTTYGYQVSPGASSYAPASYAPGYDATRAPQMNTYAADSYGAASPAAAAPYASGTTSYGYGDRRAPEYHPSGPAVHGAPASSGSAYQTPGSQAYGSSTNPRVSAGSIERPEGFIPGPYSPRSSVPGAPPRDSTVPSPAAPLPGAPFSGQGAAQAAQVPGRPDCPAGLEYLTHVEQIVIQQKVELIEVFLGIDSANAYEAKNAMGQLIYNIRENSSFCARCCCGPQRCLEIDVSDYTNTVVIHIVRPLRCSHCCCFCCLQAVEVQAPPGTPIARIRQRWSICHPYFTIYSPEDEPALHVVGPICTESMPCKCDVKFEVRSRDGVAIGAVTKEWGGLVKEYFTDADSFNVTFPLDLAVNMKAALLALSVLINITELSKPESSCSER
ncbi:phospholipid scramblase 2-like [Rhipicephalus sanguineus]|uniref:phospholipid scramblase 2-like n=1 Tax=Rhipicephalus sanguineus TaxID=34632 RepID=UPI0020C30641|nr:phospholipid scramblase 2-like [Rhipicephalus sanguineus]